MSKRTRMMKGASGEEDKEHKGDRGGAEEVGQEREGQVME